MSYSDAGVPKITWAFCFLTSVCHAGALGGILLYGRALTFPFEAVVASCIAWGASLTAALVRKRFHFSVAESLHLIDLVALAFILGGRVPGVEVLALAPFLSGLALYAEDWKIVHGVAVGTCTVFLWADLRPLGPWIGPEKVFHALVTACGALFLYAAARLLVGYRERLAERERQAAGYEDAFSRIVKANLDLQTLAASAESQSAEKERMRITRELHDSLGYSLTNTIMTINAALLLATSDAATEEEAREDRERMIAILKDAKENAECHLQDTRTILYQLRTLPEDTGRRGLGAVARLARAFGTATGLQVDCNFGNLPWTMGEPMDRALYRLVQEGLTNSFRHGRATVVRIQSRIEGGVLHISVTDNGGGAPEVKEGIGLLGMRERLAALDGTFTARNVADGFELSAAIPIAGKEGLHGEAH